MPLESCPTCGSALSILSHQCRHCVATEAKLSWIERPEGKYVLLFAFALVVLVTILYVLLGS